MTVNVIFAGFSFTAIFFVYDTFENKLFCALPAISSLIFFFAAVLFAISTKEALEYYMSQGTGIFESSKSLFQSGIVLTMMGFGWFCIQVVILLAEINTHIGILVSVGIVILLIYSWISMNRARARVKID
jgi:hypothetical protein